ncbi:MAG: endolytic transglycosylase MltG [Alphaproteobacteria bacterium]
MNKNNIFYLLSVYFLSLITAIVLNNGLSLKNSGEVYISKGKSTTGIINMFYDGGFIYDRFAFRTLKSLGGFSFKSGEYKISKNDNPINILINVDNHKVFYRKIKILEGSTIRELVQNIEQNKYLTGKVHIPNDTLIFADTYYFERGTKVSKLLEDIKKVFSEKSNQIWQSRDKSVPVKDIKQAYILASIIEKETGQISEQKIVSSVFVNRLNKNMKLQSDPTVIYAVTNGLSKMDRPISKKDLRTKSPYNTYYVRGLTPTPIAIVGISAFKASLNPENTNYLYFVANGQGGHNFAKTLKQHNKNVRFYRSLKQ